MKTIYVSAPLRSATPDGERHNIIMAAIYSAHLWREGHSVVCPHLNTLLMPDICPDITADQYIRGDIAQLILFDEVHMLPDWHHSEGCTQEHNAALEHQRHCGKPILEYVDEKTMDLLYNQHLDTARALELWLSSMIPDIHHHPSLPDLLNILDVD